MRIWIDVEDASGTRYGSGPITTAVDWQNVRRIDAAGTFSFSMPASDERSNLLAHKRVVRCWGADEWGIREMGAGIIDQITVTPATASAPALLRVSGDDLLRELANVTVGDLALNQPTAYVPTLRLQTYSTGSNLSYPATVNLSPLPQAEVSFLLVQYPRPFSRISFVLTTINTTATNTFRIQYYNAQGDTPAWEDLGGVVNNTAAPGQGDFVVPFGVYGYSTVEFDPPAGWSSEGGLYTIRFFDLEADLTTFVVSEAAVVITEPVADGLQRIMAFVPTWSLDPTGVYATANPVYMQFSGESVLSALIMLAQQTGEHFTLSPSARQLRWIGAAQTSSGLRAIDTPTPGDSSMAITALSRTTDSYDLCTRLYSYGGGYGDGRVTMAQADYVGGGGSDYVLGPDGAYLQSTSAVATYGYIDRRIDFPDIVPVDVSAAQVKHASNALFDRTLHTLARAKQVQYSYALTVVPGHYDVWPGQTIRVVYHEWIDSYHAINIDAELWVLEINQQVGPNGAWVNGLTVATVDAKPASDYQMIANMMVLQRQERSASLPESGLTSIRAGVPVAMAVENGQVTSVRRVKPVEDGWYSVRTIGRLRLQGGVVTYIEPP